MDAYEATRVVYSRIQNLDPENASKVMGLLLIQDHGEKEMIRLAFGPESLVHSVILKAKKDLGLSSSSNTPSTPSTPLSFTNSISLSRHNSSNSSASSRLLNGINLPSPLSIPNLSTLNSSWAAASNFSEDLVSPNSGPNHYNFTSSNGAIKLGHGSSSSSTMNSSAPPFYGSGESENDLIDEYQLQDQLSFLNEGPKSPDFYYPQSDLAPANWAGSVNGLHHRRSCSVTDICLGSEDPTGGFWWKPCLYYARGYCKNGTSCRFLHVGLSDSDGDGSMVGSPSKMEMMEQCHELLRSKSAQQQRLAAVSQLMAGSNSPYSPSKCMNFLLQQQNDSPRGAAGLMMADEMNKFARSPRFERSDFSMNGGMGMVNSVSRQIYLTFPADSTFREEDVSNYFSIYGPVQDVRIPYQQKRMFGFVTFVYPETVKIILAKGNPHFVCDARVLVKPYKEKGKIPDKFRKQQLMERGEFPACGSPTSLDSRDPFDLQLGARMLYNSQDLLWRRKLEEQADLEQAIELQNRRLMGLQLLDLKRSHHHRALSTGAAISSPTHSPNFYHQNLVLPSSNRSSPEFPEENGSVSALANNAPVTINEQPANVNEKEKDSSNLNDQNTNGKASPHHDEESDLQESLEHNLPENLFASPKAAGEDKLAFTIDTVDAEKKRAMVSIATPSSANNNLMASSLLPATSTLDMASLNSCYFQAPRFTSSHGAMGM